VARSPRPAADHQVNQDDRRRLREDGRGHAGSTRPSPWSPPRANEAICQTEPLTAESKPDRRHAIQRSVAHQADLSQDEIGASWGRRSRDGAIGLVVFLVLVVLFIWAYFRQWKMSVAAIVALAHDVVITIGIYCPVRLRGHARDRHRLLTILGFSLYDTVVVFDKVRENTKNLRASDQTYAEAANLAVNQTLVRSINTSIVAADPGRRDPVRRARPARLRVR
jgi:preprotein translocase subunit SecF